MSADTIDAIKRRWRAMLERQTRAAWSLAYELQEEHHGCDILTDCELCIAVRRMAADAIDAWQILDEPEALRFRRTQSDDPSCAATCDAIHAARSRCGHPSHVLLTGDDADALRIVLEAATKGGRR